MKSAKVANKILLISLAFGSVTFIAGMLAKDANIQKALVGAGAAGSIAGLSGALVINSKNKSEDNPEAQISDHKISELRSQEAQLQKSLDEATLKMQGVEADINSLQTEHNQLLNIVSDLNNQKQQLEQVISPIEESFVDLSIDNNSEESNEISNKPELKIDQLVNSLETSELEDFNSEIETSEASIEQIDPITETIEEDINPFTNSRELSESIVDENDSDLAMVDKLIGAFDESELEMFEQESPVQEEYSIDQESNSEPEEEALYEEEIENLVDSEIANEIDSSSEELSDQSHLIAEQNNLVDEWSESNESEIVDQPELELVAESEPSEEFSLDEPEMESEPEESSYEEMPLAESESSDAMAEFSLESEPEIIAEQDDFAGEWAEESDSIVSELTPESEISDQPELELAVESASSEEFSLDSISEMNIGSESEEFEKAFGLEEIPSVESDSYDFIENLDDDNQSNKESGSENASGTDSEFNDLMGALIDDESNADSTMPDFYLENSDEDLDELSSLDSVDKKLDELTKISDESLEELNDLLGSVQENKLSEEQELDEIFQDI